MKEVINGLEMSYKYSNVDEDNTLVPQEIVLHAIALLKAQEPVTPILDETGMFRCANCKKQAVGYKNFANEIFRHNLYCPKCGRAVKWDD